MALKGERQIIDADIRYTCSTEAERGVGVVHDTSGSGVALGSSAGNVKVVANPSGAKFAGLLLNDMVDIDETRYHRNFHKDEMKIGERCHIAKRGYFTTNKIIGTPAVGDVATLSSSGNFEPGKHASGGYVARPPVGTFTSIKDADGYATIELNVPIVL